MLLILCFYQNAYSNKTITSVSFKNLNPIIITDTGKVNDKGIYLSSSNPIINNLFSTYKIKEFRQLYPSAKNTNHPKAKSLLNYYYFVSDTDMVLLKEKMVNNYKTYFDSVYVAYQPELTAGEYVPNDPVDASWNLYRILNIKAREAWAITKGSANIKIAILEPLSDFQLTHEDLVDQIVYTNTTSVNSPSHGTYVAGCAAACTDNGKGISSVGFNSKLMLMVGSYNGIIDAANMGASVINCSWIDAVGNECIYEQSKQDIINMVTDMGTIIVSGAANGTIGGVPVFASCGNGHGLAYPASYDNVISVSSVNQDDKIENTWCCLYTCSTLHVHTHNSKVDILAPGFCVYTTDPTYGYDIWGTGTSFASPITAGTVGLLKSINPCLKTPQIEIILKNSGDDVSAISNNASYYASPSLVPKRLNAYKAVIEAVITASLFFKNQTLAGTNVYQASYGIYAGGNPDFLTLTGPTTIATNANITFKATQEINLGSDFEVQLGAIFEAKTELINCQ